MCFGRILIGFFAGVVAAVVLFLHIHRFLERAQATEDAALEYLP